MPLIRRLPKRGFSNANFKTIYGVVNVDDLETFAAGTEVTEDLLRKAGLVRGRIDGVKVLARGEITRPLTVCADHFSESAKEKIEKVGGTVVVRQKGVPAKETT